MKATAPARNLQRYPGPRLVERDEDNGESIQIENGDFTRIHNRILEALALTRLTGMEWSALMVIFRMTYGWQKKEDTISYQQFSDAMHVQRHHVMEALKKLEARHIIHIRDNGPSQTKTYSFNKYTEQWDDASIRPSVTPQRNTSDAAGVTPQRNTGVTSQGNTGVTPQRNKSVTPQGTHQRKKESIKKEKETTTTEGVGGGVILDPAYAAVCDRYQNEIGPLSSLIADNLSDLLAEYKDPRLICDAIGVAVKNNKRKLSYVEGVLKNWRANGKGEGAHGKSQVRQPPTDGWHPGLVQEWRPDPNAPPIPDDEINF